MAFKATCSTASFESTIFNEFPHFLLTNTRKEFLIKELTQTGACVSGHVLIIDAMSNRRIQMQAVLDTACYKLCFAESQLEGLSRIKEDVPDVVILAHDLPGLKLPKFCRLLRETPALQLVSVIVAVPRENQSARLAALTAGATDVIEYSVDASELQARIRSYVRILQASQEIQQRTGPNREFGFAEHQKAFESAIRVTVVQETMVREGLSTCFDADTHIGIETRHVSLAHARRGLTENCDVIVLFESSDAIQSRDTLGALRVHPKTRHAAILYVAASDNKPESSPLDLGAQDQVSADVTDAEILLRVRRLAGRKRIEDIARAEIFVLGEKAYKDALTGLHNRQYAKEYLHKQDRLRSEHPSQCAVLMVDIDHFKRTNDTHGHAAGDAILAHVALSLKAHVREGDMIARYGGEEFLVVLPNIGANEARAVADRLRKRIASQPKQFDDGTHAWTTVSIGMAHTTRATSLGSNDLIRAADMALYRAKAEGRNILRIATHDDFTASLPVAATLK
jgi:two-component system cell cycle response regulator